MKGTELDHGQFFHHQNPINSIGRRVNDMMVFFDMGIKKYGGCTDLICEPASNWQSIDVEPINFQIAFIALLQECAEYPYPQENETTFFANVPAKDLPEGNWFYDVRGNVGRRFRNVFAFLFQTNDQISVVIENMGLVTPISRQQALLRITQNIMLLENVRKISGVEIDMWRY